MNDFYKTLMGSKFYGADVPRIVKALERIATALENQNKNDILSNKSKESV